MIRIILKESKYGISDRDYGLKHVRFLKMIHGLRDLVNQAALLTVEKIPAEMKSKNDKIKEIANQLWLEIIEQIEPLKKEHIVKELGFGALGGAFLLTNGNVLKIGVDGDGTNLNFKNDHIPPDIAKDHFKGKGTATELHVHDFGQIKMPWHGKFSGTYFDEPWSWREVPKYTTFWDWLRRQDLSIYGSEVRTIGIEMTRYITKYSRQTERPIEFEALYKWFMSSRGKAFYLLELMKENDAKKLLKAMYDITIRRFNLSSSEYLDLKADNLGVDQHGNFVFFDF